MTAERCRHGACVAWEACLTHASHGICRSGEGYGEIAVFMSPHNMHAGYKECSSLANGGWRLSTFGGRPLITAR